MYKRNTLFFILVFVLLVPDGSSESFSTVFLEETEDLESYTDHIVKEVSFSSLSSIIRQNVKKVDSNNDKIADYLVEKKGELELILLFEDFDKLPPNFDNFDFTILKTFQDVPAIGIKTDASELVEISMIDGLAVVEENLPIKKLLSYSTSQLGVRPYLWDTGLTGSSDFSIAVLDSGIDTSHPAFAGRIVATYNAFDDNATSIDDYDGHGTHVTGIAAGLAITGPTSFVQTTRSDPENLVQPGLPNVEGAFFAEILLANVNDTATINVGIDWASEGKDFPGSSAFIGVVDKEITQYACGTCRAEDDTGEFSTSFTINDPGDYYIIFGNNQSAGNQYYEGWAEVTYDSKLPHQKISDDYESHAGVAFGSNIVSVKVLDSDGNGDSFTFDNAITWVKNHKEDYNITVVNLSLGVADAVVATIDSKVATLVNDGIVVVAAAGNDGPNSGGIFTPASTPEVITVGAVNRFNEIAYYSSHGDSQENILAMKPDVVAPGGSGAIPANGWDSGYDDGLGYIVAPDSNFVNYNSYPDDLIGNQGTSMAAPHISGLVALMVQHIHDNKGWTWDVNDVYRIKRAILAGTFEVGNIGSNGGESCLTCDPPIPDSNPPINRDGKDYVEGWGAVNAQAALGALSEVLPLNKNHDFSMSLEDPFISNVRAWNFVISANQDFTFRGIVPIGADVDLLVIDTNSGSNGDLNVLYSATNGKGVDEEILIRESVEKEVMLVVRLVDSDNVNDDISIVMLDPSFVPSITMISPLNDTFFSSTTVEVLFESPSNTVDTYLDNINQGEFHSGDELVGVNEGSHNLTLIETNLNESISDRAYVNFTVDLTDPLLASDLSILSGNFYQDPVLINFSISDNFGLSRIEVLVDGIAVNTTVLSSLGLDSSILLNPKSSTPDTHEVILKVYDKAGNFASHTVITTFTHSVYIIKHANVEVEISESVTIEWSAGTTDSGDNYQLYIGGVLVLDQMWDGFDISYSLFPSTIGTFEIKLIVYTTTGDSAEDVFLLTLVDTTYPLISGPLSGVYDATEGQQIQFSVVEFLPQKIEILIDGTTSVKAVPWDGNPDFTHVKASGIPGDETNVTAIVEDQGGLISSLTILISWKDLTPPSITGSADFTFNEGEADKNLVWEWVEKFPTELRITQNSDLIAEDENPDYTSISIKSDDLNSLSSGMYEFILTIKDANDASSSDTVIVNIIDNKSSDGSSKNPSAFLSAVENYLLGFSILILVFLRKRKSKIFPNHS
ncbi:MAG: S8 family serine peptidase [Candidatus Kariarchaeaceae archaeon]|jgi:subtilisin family serine protease